MANLLVLAYLFALLAAGFGYPALLIYNAGQARARALSERGAHDGD